MKLELEIPDSFKTNLETRLEYESQIDNGDGEMIDNPQTPEEYIREKVQLYVQNEYIAAKVDETDNTIKTVKDQAVTDADQITVKEIP